MLRKIILIFCVFVLVPFIAHATEENKITITEIQIAGATSKDEFIEIHNSSQSPVNLKNWRLTKKTKSGSESNLLTKFPDVILEPNHYFLIVHKTDYTGNVREDAKYSTSSSIATDNTIYLKDEEQNIIDYVGLGDTTLSQGEPAQVPGSSKSIERKRNDSNEYIDTQNNNNDFILQDNPNPQNIESNNTTPDPPNDDPVLPPITQPTQSSTETKRPWAIMIPNSLLINEVMPSPLTGEKEWVEIYNNTDMEIELDDCKIIEGSQTKTNLTGTIQPGSFYTKEGITGGLNNSGDIIELVCFETIIDRVVYGDFEKSGYENIIAPKKNQTLSRIFKRVDLGTGNNVFNITTTPTQNKENIITEPAVPTPKPATPKPVTRDPPTEIKSDPSMTNNKTLPEKVNADPIPPPEKPKETQPIIQKIECPSLVAETPLIEKPKEEILEKIEYPKLLISEFLPNPQGADTNEWIEIFNPTDTEVNLKDWQIDDQEGQSKPYTLQDKTIIKAKDYLLLERKETKIALNNTTDSVRLINPAGIIVDEISYEDISEDTAYAINESNNWVETIKPTPQKPNIIEKNIQNKTTTKTESIITKTGIISATTETIYKKSLFIEPEGFEIYLSKGNFPKLEEGDEIQISGTLSKTNDKKISVTTETQLKVITKNNKIPVNEIQINQINEESKGSFVKLSGEILEVDGKKIYLDDGTGEITIYIKSSNLLTEKVHEADKIIAKGIIVESNNELRLYPREADDIKITEKAPTKEPDKTFTAYQDTNQKSDPIPPLSKVPLYSSLLLNLAMGLRIMKSMI